MDEERKIQIRTNIFGNTRPTKKTIRIHEIKRFATTTLFQKNIKIKDTLQNHCVRYISFSLCHDESPNTTMLSLKKGKNIH